MKKRNYLQIRWYNMIKRCYDDKSTHYKRYGGRGIKVCDEWLEYDNFKEWCLNNGYLESLTIDRINNNGNYEPSNCRFVDKITQANNRSKNRIETYQGTTDTVSNLCRKFNKDYLLTNRRLQLGYTIEQAFDLELNSLYTPNNKYHLIEYKGELKTLTEWSKVLGFKRTILGERLKNWNYDIDKCFNTPIRKRKETQ